MWACHPASTVPLCSLSLSRAHERRPVQKVSNRRLPWYICWSLILHHFVFRASTVPGYSAVVHEMLCLWANKICLSLGLTSPKGALKSWKSRRKQDPDMQAKRSVIPPVHRSSRRCVGQPQSRRASRRKPYSLAVPRCTPFDSDNPISIYFTPDGVLCFRRHHQSGGIFGAAATSPTNNRLSGHSFRDSPKAWSSDIYKYWTCMEKSFIGGRLSVESRCSACLLEHPNHVPTLDLPFLASRQLQQKLGWTDNRTCSNLTLAVH